MTIKSTIICDVCKNAIVQPTPANMVTITMKYTRYEGGSGRSDCEEEYHVHLCDCFQKISKIVNRHS